MRGPGRYYRCPGAGNCGVEERCIVTAVAERGFTTSSAAPICLGGSSSGRQLKQRMVCVVRVNPDAIRVDGEERGYGANYWSLVAVARDKGVGLREVDIERVGVAGDAITLASVEGSFLHRYRSQAKPCSATSPGGLRCRLRVISGMVRGFSLPVVEGRRRSC